VSLVKQTKASSPSVAKGKKRKAEKRKCFWRGREKRLWQNASATYSQTSLGRLSHGEEKQNTRAVQKIFSTFLRIAQKTGSLEIGGRKAARAVACISETWRTIRSGKRDVRWESRRRAQSGTYMERLIVMEVLWSASYHGACSLGKMSSWVMHGRGEKTSRQKTRRGETRKKLYKSLWDHGNH